MKFNIILFSTLITDAVSKSAPYHTGILSPSFTRKLVTQECLDGELLMLEDEKLDNLTGALYAACPAANQITVDGDGSMSRISDMTDCDTTSITEYCDANVNYKSATLRPNIEIACTNISITNSTSGEVMNLPEVTQQFINNVGCFAQSCPDDVDWTAEDIAQNAEAQVPPGASCTVLFLEEKSEEGAVASAIPSSPATVVDLSKELEVDGKAISSSPGSMEVNNYASSNPLIRTMMVLEDGKVVAKYVREDVDENVPYAVMSVTKSWISLIAGMLIDEGKISLDSTLGSIFTDEQTWEDIPDTEIRKAITIKELLTMKSGINASGEGTLKENLAIPMGVRGVYSYGGSDILGFVTLEVSGLSPRQYLDQNVLPKLGIERGDIEWGLNSAGMENVMGGLEPLELTLTQMAKFGQVYLQGGMAGPSESSRVVSEGWVDESWSVYTDEANPAASAMLTAGLTREEIDDINPPVMGHGFLWYTRPFSNKVWCADGNGGQHICVAPSLGRVVVQQTDRDIAAVLEVMANGDTSAFVDLVVPEFSMSERVGEIALDDDLSFNADVTKTSSAIAMSMATAGGTTMFAIAMLVMLDVLY